MTDWLLGLIALGTLTTALLEVVVVVALVRIGRRALARAERLKAMVAPLPAHLAEVSANLSRARAITDAYAARLSEVQALIGPPLRQGLMAFSVAKGITQLFRGRRRARSQASSRKSS